MLKNVAETFSANELKIEKVKFFTQNWSKIFCINVFNVGGCLASCLAFRPFLLLDPEVVTWLLLKKHVYFSGKKLVLSNLNAIFPLKVCCNFSLKIIL